MRLIIEDSTFDVLPNNFKYSKNEKKMVSMVNKLKASLSSARLAVL